MDSKNNHQGDSRKDGPTSVDGDHISSGREIRSKSIPDIASVDLKTVHGPVNDSNHFTLHYSVTGFVAFACQHVIVVVDSKCPNKAAQVLIKHKDPVCVVKWISSSINDGLEANLMKLASGDVKGNIVIWDVIRGASICIIPAENSSILRETQNILSFEWIKCPSRFMSSSSSSPSKVSPRKYSKDNLLVLYPKNLLVLYDSDSGQIIWRKHLFVPSSSMNALSLLTKSSSNQFNVNCNSFSIDPYNGENMILTVSAIDPTHEPCSFIVVYNYFATSTSVIDDGSNSQCFKYSLFVTDFVQQSSPTSSPDLKLQLMCQIFNPASFLFESKPSNRPSRSSTPIPATENQFVVELKHVCYSESRKEEVIVASSRVITIVNLRMDQVVATIALERNCSNLLAIHSSFQRNAIFTCHKSGSIYFRASQSNLRFDEQTSTQVMDVSYKTMASSEPVKMSKDTSVVGFSVSPLDEIKMCLLLSNGKLIFSQLIKSGSGNCSTLSDMITLGSSQDENTFQLKEFSKLSSLNKPVIIKSCPPVTKSNWSVHRPLIAIGDFSGSIQIYDLRDGSIDCEYESMHGNQVRGIEWSSLTSFLSWSYPPVSPTPYDIRTTNELMMTDISTNCHEVIRKERNNDSSPIQGIKVSHLKQYFIISFRSDPLEIWDLQSLSLLKVMTTFKSPVTAIEWSPISSSKKASFITSSTISSDQIKDKDTLQQILPPSNSSSMTTSLTDGLPSLTRENFVISSSSGDLFHYSVENVSVKEISVIHGDYSHGYLTSIAWKENVVTLGFQDGNLLIWDLKKKESKSKQTHSKEVVRKIKFGPGKGNPNFLVLYKDYLEMWDLTDFQVISQLKSSSVSRSESFTVVDFDWIGSDRPVLLTSTGLLLVTDLFLSKYSTSMELIKSFPGNGSLSEFNYFTMKDNLKFTSIINFIRGNESKSPDSLLKRCLEASILSGSLFHFVFWSLVGHHVLELKNLDHYFEMYLSNSTFRQIQEERVASYEAIRTGFHPLICEYHLLLGNHQRGVQMLLESDSSVPDKYLKNGLKACLIASLQACNTPSSTDEAEEEPSSVEPVIKLVAASLIASGSVDDGVQLLYLIGKICDSCRYLQSNNQWKKSIWVAKTSLREEQSHEFLKRWSDHLVQEDLETKEEILVQLSLKQFEKVLVSLVNRSDVLTAALFAKLWKISSCFPKQESFSIQGTFEFVSSRYLSLLKGHQLPEDTFLRDLLNDYSE